VPTATVDDVVDDVVLTSWQQLFASIEPRRPTTSIQSQDSVGLSHDLLGHGEPPRLSGQHRRQYSCSIFGRGMLVANESTLAVRSVDVRISGFAFV